MTHAATGAVWLGVYLTIVLAPVAALLLVPTPPGGGFWWDVSMGLGFAGLTMMAVQFVLTARFRRATAPFGIDVIYAFHRHLAWTLLVVIGLHPTILIIRDPTLIRAVAQPWTFSWEISSGTISVVLLLAVVLVSACRKQLRIPYELWRATHLVLSLGAVGFAFMHMFGISHYTKPPLIRGLWWLIGLSLCAIVLHVRLVRPLTLHRRPYTITDVRPDLGDAWNVVVEPQGHDGFRFEPGQFAWLSVDRSPLRMGEHPFSIASSPRTDGTLEFVIKELGDFTRTIGTTTPGTPAWVDGPYGAFSIDRHLESPGFVFIAGGIGIAPIASMLRSLAERGDRRPHVLFGGHSRWDRIPMREEIERLSGVLDLTVVHVLEEPHEGWAGERGWITPPLLDRHLPSNRARHHYFVCGPVPMIRAVEGFLGDLEIPRGHIHTELFDMA